MQWIGCGKKYSMDIKGNSFPEVLKDRSGLINTERVNEFLMDSLVVYEADNRERFRISPPHSNHKPLLDTPHFYYFRFNKLTGKYECLFFDGIGDSIGDLNLLTGEITNIRQTRV